MGWKHQLDEHLPSCIGIVVNHYPIAPIQICDSSRMGYAWEPNKFRLLKEQGGPRAQL